MRGLPRPEGNSLMSSQIHPDQSADGSADEGAGRPGLTRRSVLAGASLAGAGLAATAMVGTLAAPAAAAPRVRPGEPAASVPHSAEPVIVHVRDLRSGDMDVFAGETKTRLRDPALAAKLAAAAR